MSGPTAFPQTETSIAEHPDYQGLTKRELFAAMALQGYVVSVAKESNIPGYFYARAASESVAHADALIAELAKEQK